MNPEEKAYLFDTIRSLMGYVQNGSETTVTLFQDDATHTYHIKVGNNSYWGNSLKEAIEKAEKAHPDEFRS